MSRTNENPASGAAVLLAMLLLGPSAAFVMSRLWLWFVVPLGGPPIGAAHAFGLCMMWTLLNWKYRPNEKKGTVEDVWTCIGTWWISFAMCAVAKAIAF